MNWFGTNELKAGKDIKKGLITGSVSHMYVAMYCPACVSRNALKSSPF